MTPSARRIAHWGGFDKLLFAEISPTKEVDTNYKDENKNKTEFFK